jgi:hypothetical protein
LALVITHKKADVGRYIRRNPERQEIVQAAGWVFRRMETLMANVDFRYAPGQTLRYLDASPMISALRFRPEDFEYAHGWLRHVPSRHRFQFDRLGRVTIDAMCGCAAMSIKPEQTDELVTMFKTWRQEYWLPLETNREFASHFNKPNAWVRLLRDIRMAFRRFLRRSDPVRVPAGALSPVSVTPAE